MIESYNKLPVGLYLELSKVAADSSLDELTQQVRIIAILSGKTEDEILDMPVTDYSGAVERLSFLQQPYHPSGRIASSYKVGKFDLRPFRDWTEMTTAQFIDYKTYAGKGIEECLVEIVSVLLVPAGHRYNTDYDIAEVQQAIRDDLPVTDVLDVAAFFFTQWTFLLKDSLISLKRRCSRMPEGEEKEALARQIRATEIRLGTAGDGSTTSSSSPVR